MPWVLVVLSAMNFFVAGMNYAELRDLAMAGQPTAWTEWILMFLGVAAGAFSAASCAHALLTSYRS